MAMISQHFRTVFLVFSLLTFSAAQLSAQRTLVDTHPLELYKKGLELYKAQHYAAAQKVFYDYLKSNDNNASLRAEANYYIATSALELFQEDAEILLTRFTQDFPAHPKARLANFYLGRFQFRQQDYAKALMAFEKVDLGDLGEKEQSDYNFMTGYSYYRTKNNKKAKEYLAKVKDVENDNKAIASYYYGFISYEENNYNDALREFLKIKDEKKFKAVIPMYVTQIYLLQGKYDKVIQFGEEALASKETEKADDVRMYVAEAYFRTKNFPKAADMYTTHLKNGGALTDHHYYQLGYAQYVNQQYAEAINSFNQVNIQQDSLGQNISYHLAGAYVKNGDKLKARNAYDFASKLKFTPAIEELSLLNYAKLSYDLNFQKEAIDALKLFIKTYPKSGSATEAKELLGQILLASNNPKEALDVIESIPNRSDKLDEAYQKILYMYGIELFNNRQYEEAEQKFSSSLKYNFDRKLRALAFFWLGETQYKLNNVNGALTNYKNYLYIGESRQTPYVSLAYYNLGYCYFRQEEYIQSKNYFKQYIDAESRTRNNRYNDAVIRQADCNFALKDYPSALRGYDEIINARTPEADYATYQKGLIQGLTGNTDAKIATLRTLSPSNFPKSAYIDDALYSIGESYMNRGDFAQAIKEFQSLNYNYPKNRYFIIAQLNIGIAYINMEQDNKAIPILKGIVSKYPSSLEAKQAMKFIQNSYIDRGMTDSLDQFLASVPNVSLSPNSQDSVLYTSAFNNYKKNDCEATIRSMERYLEKYPNGYFAVEAYFYMADCELRTKREAKALKHLDVVINRSPNQFMERALKASAELYFEQKDYQMALRRYEQLEQTANIKQNVFLAIVGQMEAQYLLQNYEGTVAAANKVLDLGFADEASKTKGQFYIGRSHLAAGKLDLAMQAFTQVQKLDKAEMGAEAMYNMAYIYYLQEKYTDAENTIFDLKDKYAFYNYWKAKAFILLSDVYVKMGDTFQAKATLQSIIDNYEGAEIKKEAQEKLNAIKASEKGGK